MPVEEPSEALHGFALIRGSFTPLVLTDLVNGGIESLDDVKAIEDQLGIRTVFLDGSDVSFAHVAAGPLDLGSPVGTESLCEEPIDRFTRPAAANPHHAGAVQIVNERGVPVTLGVGDLVDPDGFEPSDTMTFTKPRDGSVKEIRQRRGRDAQQLGRRLLHHGLAVAQHGILEAIRHPREPLRPRNLLDHTTVGRTPNLPRMVEKPDPPPAHRNVTPPTRMGHCADDFTSTAALRTTTTILMWLYGDDEAASPLKPPADNTEPLESQQFR